MVRERLIKSVLSCFLFYTHNTVLLPKSKRTWADFLYAELSCGVKAAL